MDLFTYLMAKNGNNSSVHGDLFSYLLGKAQGGGGQIKTASGITIYIPDATRTGIVSFMMTKESTQIGTPTPDNPVPVNVVEGYRNLFDKDNEPIYSSQTSLNKLSTGIKVICETTNTNLNVRYIVCDLTNYEGQTITARTYAKSSSTNLSMIYLRLCNSEGSFTSLYPAITSTTTRDGQLNVSLNVPETLDNTYHYLLLALYGSRNTSANIGDYVDYTDLFIGIQDLPYVPYGNNYITVNISDGTNTNKYPIPLNNNIIAGIGDYKDELKVDKSGNVFINKKTGKVVFDGTTNAFNLKSSSIKNTLYLTPEIDNIKRASVNTETVPAFCSHFINSSSFDIANANIIAMGIRVDERINFGFGLSSNLTTLEQANQWLTTQYNNGTPVTTYYPLATPELIDLQTTVDLKLFKGVNNISNSEDGYMTIEYR